MTDTPEEIAARLTEAQRRALLDASGYACGGKSTIYALYKMGLVGVGNYVAPLRTMGHAVRAVLEAQRDGE